MKQEPFLGKTVLMGMMAAAIIVIVCFAIVAFAPISQESPAGRAVRGLLTGLGVLAIAYPLCALGLAIKRRGAGSPYYEIGFIATVINVFGLACIGVGLACIGFGAYDLIRFVLDSQ